MFYDIFNGTLKELQEEKMVINTIFLISYCVVIIKFSKKLLVQTLVRQKDEFSPIRLHSSFRYFVQSSLSTVRVLRKFS